MKRIVMLASNPCNADARILKMAHAAREAGHEVHIFATAKNELPNYECKDGITFHRLVWQLGPALKEVLGKSVSSRVAGYIAKRLAPYIKYHFYKKIFSPYIENIEPDIIHAHDLITLPAGYHAAKKCGAELVYDAHELEVHRNPPLSRAQKFWVSYIERRYSIHAKAVITVGRHCALELEKHLGRKIHVIYNSPILHPCPTNIRKDLRIPEDTPLIVYVGKIAAGRGLEGIVRALSQMRDIHLAAVGPSDPRSHSILKSLIERLKLAERVHLLPPVPYEQVVAYIRSADMGILPVQKETLSYELAMPNKLFEMSFAELPILSNDLVEISEFLSEINNGKAVDFDSCDIGYEISSFLHNKDRYTLSDEKRGVLFEKYSWDSQKKKLLDIYNDILSNRTPPETP